MKCLHCNEQITDDNINFGGVSVLVDESDESLCIDVTCPLCGGTMNGHLRFSEMEAV